MGMYTTIKPIPFPMSHGDFAGNPQVAGNFRAADPRCGCAVEGAGFFFVTGDLYGIWDLLSRKHTKKYGTSPF
jgi:hypothetical protein